MRFYLKLTVMALLAFGGQALVSAGVLGETYFAVRCLVAHASGDAMLERRLLDECERQFAADNSHSLVVLALNASARAR